MQITPRSETDARRVAHRKLLPPGWHTATITEAAEKSSRAGNDMVELVLTISDGDSERELRDYLVDSAASAMKVRNLCVAIGALERYEAGEIAAADFVGATVSAKLAIEKKRGFADRNTCVDYRAAR